MRKLSVRFKEKVERHPWIPIWIVHKNFKFGMPRSHVANNLILKFSRKLGAVKDDIEKTIQAISSIIDFF